MNSILLSTAYLPPVSWMVVAIQSVGTGIEIHETYPKQTFRNRCNIATSSGILSLTVPVKRINGNHTKTADIVIDNATNWQHLHWHSILTAYNKSPYFLYYRDLFEPIFHKNHTRLIDLNQEFLATIIKILKKNSIQVSLTEQYEFHPSAIDLRNSFHPKNKPYQSITHELPRYMQVFEENHGFIPDLSVIDLLFNLGPDSIQYLLKVELTIKSKINSLPDIQS